MGKRPQFKRTSLQDAAKSLPGFTWTESFLVKTKIIRVLEPRFLKRCGCGGGVPGLHRSAAEIGENPNGQRVADSGKSCDLLGGSGPHATHRPEAREQEFLPSGANAGDFGEITSQGALAP